MVTSKSNSNKSKPQRSLCILRALWKKMPCAEFREFRDKKMLKLRQQSVSVTIGNHMDWTKVTSVTREVIIDNDGGRLDFSTRLGKASKM